MTKFILWKTMGIVYANDTEHEVSVGDFAIYHNTELRIVAKVLCPRAILWLAYNADLLDEETITLSDAKEWYYEFQKE